MADDDLILAELELDPTKQGYRDNGQWRPVEELTAMLCRQPDIPNPTPAPQIAPPVDFMAVLKLMPQAELKAIPFEAIQLIHDTLTGGQIPAAVNWMGYAMAMGWISQQTAGALSAAVSRTIPDPTWPATVIGPCRLEIVTDGRNKGAISGERVARLLGLEVTP